MFKSIYTTVISNIQKPLGIGSGWIIDSVINLNISIIANYNRLAGSIYIKLPKELNHPRKDVINIQNIDDDECFKWFLVRYLHLANPKPKRITKVNKNFAKKFDFNKDIKFPVKARDIQKIEKK